MAMKQCKECGAEISKSAKVCPHCGKKQKKHTLLIIIALILAFIIGIACASAEDNPKSGPQKVSLQVGQETTVDNIKFSFISSSDYNYDESFKPKDGFKIIKVEIKVTNNDSKDYITSALECYADNEKCENYYWAGSESQGITLENISSGKSITGIEFFEVPENANSIICEYETNVWDNSKIEFDIQ